MNLAKALKFTRKKMKCSSAKAFFNYLEAKAQLSFNYSYYTRIESGAVIPSSDVVNQLAGLVESQFSEHLLKSYCQDLFPKYDHIFKSKQNSEDITASSEIKVMSKGQDELTLKQIAVIRKSILHYQLFLILTLARKKIPFTDLSSFVEDPKIEKVVKDMEKVKLLEYDQKSVKATSIEYRFPEAFNATLEETYRQFDVWDLELKEKWSFRNKKKKFFLRRTSQKHISLLAGFLSQIDELVRAADEFDENLNDEVIVFSYSFDSGKLPG